MTLAIDGIASAAWSSGSSFTVSGLTTANGSDVIVACINTEATALITVSSLSTPGVAWESSARIQATASGSNDMEIWYGVASAPLSSVTTTINLSGTPNSTAGAIIFGVSGANTSSIPDANASLPASSNGSGSQASAPTISTSNPTDLIFVFTETFSSVTETAGSGFTLLRNQALASSGISVEYMITTATQSSLTPTWGVAGNSTLWATVVDAIQAASLFPKNPKRISYIRR